MAEKKATWYLLGIASGANDSQLGFALGWQYSGWDDVVRAISGPGSTGGIGLRRNGDVTISDAVKRASQHLYEVGVVFVLGPWRNTAMSLGGKFDWIGQGEDGGSHHDVSTQNIISKLEDPVGVTKNGNYWYQHGAPKGPNVVSQLLARTSGTGGVIAACMNRDGAYYTAYNWKSIPA